MSAQPEALRLADELDADRNWLAARGMHQQSMAEAAAELRRLHAQCDALLEALKSTGLFLHHCWCDVQMNDYSFEKLNQQMAIVAAAVAKGEQA